MANLWAFVYQTLAASVTAALLLAAKRLFLDKLSPRWQYGIWAVLAARLLLPAGLSRRTLIPNGRAALETVKTLVERRMGSVLSGPYDLTGVSAPVPLFPRGFPPPGSVTDLLFYLYAAGVVITLAWFLLSYLRLRRAVGRGLAPDPALREELEQVCRRYGLKAPRRVVVCPWAGSAFVCGLLGPVLVLPQGEVDGKILLHELLHLKYGDVWAGVLMCILRCLHWCNPLIWHCLDRAQNDCEALCDQRVLERLEGEDRREYGRILLSMAEERYARAPGTSSMANGGRNIKRRIAAIARFKRYPAGTALGSACIAAILAAACLVGAAPAQGVEVSPGWLPGALAKARLNRPTTPAGALDTYAKAVLTDNGAYLAMVTPLAEHAALAAQLEGQDYYHLGLSDVLKELDFPSLETWMGGEPIYWSYSADWRIFNFLEGAGGSYTGQLALDCTVWRPRFDGRADDYVRTVYQEVQVVPDGDGWTVEPLSAWTPILEPDSLGAFAPTPYLPHLTYVAEAGGLRVELDYQYLLGVYNRTEQEYMFYSSPQGLDHIPRPDTLFTMWYRSGGGQAIDLSTGFSVDLNVNYLPMTRKQLEQGDPDKVLQRGRPRSTALPDEVGHSGGGGADAAGGAEYQSAPAAMALSFRWNGEEYTCIAYLEGGAP